MSSLINASQELTKNIVPMVSTDDPDAKGALELQHLIDLQKLYLNSKKLLAALRLEVTEPDVTQQINILIRQTEIDQTLFEEARKKGGEEFLKFAGNSSGLSGKAMTQIEKVMDTSRRTLHRDDAY